MYLLDTSDFSSSAVKELAKEMSKLDVSDLACGKCHSLPKTFIPKDLETCDKVWLRVDRVRKSLEAPYSGPYKVIKRMPKHFQIQLSDDVHSCVSIDRLKPVTEPHETSEPSTSESLENSQVQSDADNDTSSTDSQNDVNSHSQYVAPPQAGE